MSNGRYSVREDHMIAVANAIRNKCDISTDLAFPNDFIDAINSIDIHNNKNAAITADTEIIWLVGAKTLSVNSPFQNYKTKIFYFPDLEETATYAFRETKNLEALVFPVCTRLASYTVWITDSTANAPAIDIYQPVAFGNVSPFRLAVGADVILRSSTMYANSGFTASIFGLNQDVKFYVPESLLTNYRQNSYWGTFGDSRILPIDGSRYEDIDWWRS